MKHRKPVMEDPAVKAALAELKRAALAVNGDDEVKNTILTLDLISGRRGALVVFSDLCPCRDCLERHRDALFGILEATAADGVRQLQGGKVLHS